MRACDVVVVRMGMRTEMRCGMMRAMRGTGVSMHDHEVHEKRDRPFEMLLDLKKRKGTRYNFTFLCIKREVGIFHFYAC